MKSTDQRRHPGREKDPREAANRPRRDFLDFLVKSSSSAIALAAAGSLAACGGGNDPIAEPTPAPAAPITPATPAVFAFGVASGDPLADRVILWTHAKVTASTADVALTGRWPATPPSPTSSAAAA